MQDITDVGEMPEDLDERNVLVTGGSLGIGREVGRQLAARGARVTLVARDQAALASALANLPGEGHRTLAFDVSDADAWIGAMRTLDRSGALQGLVCAAGVLGPVGRLDEVPLAAISETLAINLSGTLLALRHAMPRLERSGGRAVAFSGGGATAPLPRYDAYAISKAAVVRLVENVACTTEVEINCVAPGFVATRMHQGTLDAGPEKAGAAYWARTAEQVDAGGFPAAEAAELVCLLLSEEGAGITGRLISAQWDPWREQDFRARLRTDPDLARLRRIDDQQFFAGH